MIKALLTAAAIIVPVTVTGCTLMPFYDRPESPVASTWRSGNDVTSADPAAEIAWQEFFKGEELKSLISAGIENNRDLRQAMLNVEIARAQYRIQRSNLLPTVTADGQVARQRTPETVSPTGQASTQTQYAANIATTAFEIDLFGRLRSLNAAAMEQYLATAEARNAAQITLVSEIANTYLTLLSDQAQLELSAETVQSQEETYRLLSRRFEEGIGTKLDLRQAETLLENARVDQIAFTRRVAQDLNALELLVGMPLDPAQITAKFDDVEALVSDVNAGLPSDLLQNRPDIRQAEHELKAANANIGAARAAFFPSVSLTASGGVAARELSDLFSASSGAWLFAPQVTAPIFTAGRNMANLDVATLRKEANIAAYERAIQIAFREVADALAGRQTLGDELAAQQRLVTATQDAFNIAQARYTGGIDNYLTVLDARRSLYGARQGEIATRLARLSNYIALYAALGGGQS